MRRRGLLGIDQCCWLLALFRLVLPRRPDLPLKIRSPCLWIPSFSAIFIPTLSPLASFFQLRFFLQKCDPVRWQLLLVPMVIVQFLVVDLCSCFVCMSSVAFYCLPYVLHVTFIVFVQFSVIITSSKTQSR